MDDFQENNKYLGKGDDNPNSELSIMRGSNWNWFNL